MLEEFLKVLIPLFVVLDAFAIVPAFLSLAGKRPKQVQARFSSRAGQFMRKALLAWGIVR